MLAAALTVATLFSPLAGCAPLRAKIADKVEETAADKIEEKRDATVSDLQTRTPALEADDTAVEGAKKIAAATAAEIKALVASGQPEEAKARAKTGAADVAWWLLTGLMTAAAAWLRNRHGAAAKEADSAKITMANITKAIEELPVEVQGSVKDQIRSANTSAGVEQWLWKFLKDRNIS